MTNIINFKKSEYFIFKKNISSTIGDISLHDGANLDLSLNYQSKVGGYALLSDNNREGSEWGLYEKYSPEGKLIEFRIIHMDQDEEWVQWLKEDKDPNPLNIEKFMFDWCDMQRVQNNFKTDKPFALTSNNVAKSPYWTTIDIKKGSFVIESDNQILGQDHDDVFNDYHTINCENGTYDLYHVFIEYLNFIYLDYGYIVRLRNANEDYKKPIINFMYEE